MKEKAGQPPRFNGDSVLWNGEWVTLRSLLTGLPPEEFSALARARSMDFFGNTHAFCGRCGAPAEPAPDAVTPHARRCSKPACEGYTRFYYPAFSVAILAAVTRRGGAELLLAHNTAWPAPRMSLVAGFLQPGESLEDCVRREVLEETGLRVSLPVFSGSQAWPFPCSLMAGFTAGWEAGEIRADGAEIDRAEWITRERFKAASEWTSARGDALQIPPKGSLSRRLMDDWAGK
jgi:NAD+ diphosphatase